MKTSHAQVAILGAGPCGLAFALMLARRGITPLIFEKKPGLSTHPKAMGVSRRTSEIFQQLDVFDHLYEPNRHLTEGNDVSLAIWAKSLIGEELGRTPLTERQSPFSPGRSFHCPQTLTERGLYEALEKIAPSSVKFGREAKLISGDESAVRFAVDGKEWSADWLVAADGASSGVRHALDIKCDGPGDLGHFINTFFQANYGERLKNRRGLLHHVISEEIFEFFVEVNGSDLWLMHHFLQPGETIADYPAEKLQAIIQRASGMPEVPVQILSLSPWIMSPKVAREFRRGRILLIGDAAARMSPAGGLGMNTGLQASHNLAWKLAAVIQGRAGQTLLDTYFTERHGAALWTLDHTTKNSDEIFKIVEAVEESNWRKVRDLISNSGRRGSNLGIDLGIEYPAGALIPDGTSPIPRPDPSNDYFPNARPGSRAPHFELTNGSSVLNLFGTDWVILFAGTAAGEIPAHVKSHVIANLTFASLYGLNAGGAVLIRPDGYVAARWMDPPADQAIVTALQQIQGN